MSYRNKTYVIFDGDDIRNYRLMEAWRGNENIDFNFYDAHDTRVIRTDSEKEAVKRGLRERFQNAKQVVLLVGARTKFQYQYVRWEIEVAQELGLPIVVANLNGRRGYDSDRCPAIMRDYYAVHVSFQPKIIQYALDYFPDEFEEKKDDPTEGKIRNYNAQKYADLGL